MVFKKKDIKLYILQMFIIIFTGITILLSNSIYIHLFAFLTLVIGAIVIVKFDISHPYFWYSFTFMLYSISYPIMWITGNTHDIYIYTKSLMLSQWLALSVVLLMVGPGKVEYRELENKSQTALNSKLLMSVLTISIALTIIKISRGGFTHKSEIYNESSLLIFLGFRAVLVLLILYTINLSRSCLIYESIDPKMTSIVFLSIFLMVYFSGERDLIIRFFISFLFVYFVLLKKRKIDKSIIFLGCFSLILIPILAQFKYFGLTGIRNTSDHNFIIKLLNSEFQSASKNMQILLLDESTKGIFKGATLYSSIVRTFKLDKIFNLETIHVGRWYQNRYFAANRAGQGFSLVGDGYVNFGYIGIVLVFVIVGLLIKIIYRKSKKSLYHFSYYILSIPIFMYSIRADLANILSPLIIQNLTTIVITHYFMEILYAGKIKPNIWDN